MTTIKYLVNRMAFSRCKVIPKNDFILRSVFPRGALMIVTRTASVFLLAMIAAVGSADSLTVLRSVATVPLPGVSGRIDHLAFDPESRRLFVAALGNNTVEVIDTAGNLHVRSLSALHHEPQGIAVVLPT